MTNLVTQDSSQFGFRIQIGEHASGDIDMTAG
jgi:hypothetical protein